MVIINGGKLEVLKGAHSLIKEEAKTYGPKLYVILGRTLEILELNKGLLNSFEYSLNIGKDNTIDLPTYCITKSYRVTLGVHLDINELLKDEKPDQKLGSELNRIVEEHKDLAELLEQAELGSAMSIDPHANGYTFHFFNPDKPEHIDDKSYLQFNLDRVAYNAKILNYSPIIFLEISLSKEKIQQYLSDPESLKNFTNFVNSFRKMPQNKL